MKKAEESSKKKDIQKRTFSFACRIVKLYQHLSKLKSGGEILGRQLLRSGTAIGANLEEATAGQSRADFISKCNIALKEANEIVAILTTIVRKTRQQ